MTHRRIPQEWTVRALQLGQVVAIALFALAFAVNVAGNREGAALAASAAVVILIATPLLALAATIVEARRDRPTVVAAVLVAGVLAGAIGLAVLTGP